MEKLIEQLKAFLGNRIMDLKVKGPAEVDMLIDDEQPLEPLASELRSHVIEIVDKNTLAKINLVRADGTLADSFSLNQ
ncbi:hypothetical protein QFZ20_000603 [Flavobacterium sp. W4I14]|nr:hypothetical protein [Flavobacterium sp. W4I14]